MTAHSVVKVRIDRPSAVVFDVVHDYHRRLQWDTLLRRAYTVDEAAPGRGVIAVCAAKWRLGGLAFATRYVTFDRPRTAAVTLVHPYFVFAMWSASMRHGDLPATAGEVVGSELTYTLSFRCRPNWLAKPLEAVAARMFDIETKRRLAALREYLVAVTAPTLAPVDAGH